MANNSPTIVVGSLNDEELKKSIDKLVANVDEGLNKMLQSTKNAVSEMNKTLKSLGDTKIDFGGAADGGSNRRTKAQNAETKAVNETTASYDQQAQAMQAAEKTASKYSDAIIRQAQAIRESQQWKEKGFYISGDINYYDPERANMTKRQKEQLLSLEEQILAQTKNREEAERRAAAATREEAEALNVAANGFKILNSSERQKGIGVYSQRASKVSGTEDYMGMLQRVLGLQQHEIQNVNEETDSYRKLSAQLKQLSTAYDRLTASERNSENGKQLVGSMLEIRRAMQEIQRQKSRPVRLEDVLAFKPQNLDQMADKLRELKAYRGGIDITKTDAHRKIKEVDNAIKQLNSDMSNYMSKAVQMNSINNALTRSFNYMKNRLAFYFTVGASTSFIKNLIEVRSQYEMNEKALGILLDSASRGTRIFNELSQMSLVSPYTLIELSSAAKQLTAYDVAAKDVVDTTRRLADMASAVGVPVERLTYALGQIKAYGYLNSRDARMFANAGIPLVKQLADYYSELEGKIVSTADVYDRMKKKAIDYADVMKVVNKMTDEGGKFFDFQAKMADTLKVRLANLNLAWNNMLNDIGKNQQGMINTSLKVATVTFKHWRELFRVIGTVVVALGAYKTAVLLAGLTTKSSIGGSAVAAFFSLAKGVRSAKDAVALFSTTVKQIPFAGWVTTIASLVSWFYLFNESGESTKNKLDEIKNAFNGVRKEIEDLYADAVRSDSLGTQLTKLRDMLELAQTELGITIPINLEDVNESNIKQKLKEAKRFIDDYINFSQTFSEAAADTKFNELMNEFGANARSTYTSVSESINSVVVALQELSDKGKASKRDIEILNELLAGQKDDESRIEYLQRLIKLYEELGLIGQKKVTPQISFFGSSEDNIDELEQKQEKALDRLGIKNKEVFATMLTDVQGYYSSSSIAAYQFEQQVMRVAKKIDINNIPVEQRTMKLQAAINEEASLNNWNQFEKEFARQIANEKFGTNIEISEESKNVAESELQDWQKKQQEWAKKNGITFDINFQTNDTEISYAKRQLQAAKDAQEEWQTQQRKLEVGTGSQEAVDKAKKDYENARTLARLAGADLSSLDKQRTKAQKQAESELSKALKEELKLIEQVRSAYKTLTDAGKNRTDAIEESTKGFEKSVAGINNILGKYGLKFDISKFAGITNPHELQDMLQKQLNALFGKAKPAEIQAIEVELQKINLDVSKFDQKTIADSLNNELGKLNQEYELAVSLDADPEFGSMFADMFGINLDSLPRTVSEYADEYTKLLNKYLSDNKTGIELPHLYLTDDDLHEFERMVKEEKLNAKVYEQIAAAVNNIRQKTRKDIEDTGKEWNSMIEKYGGLQAKLMNISKSSSMELRSLVKKFGSKEQIKEAIDLVDKIRISEDQQEIARLREELNKIINDITSNNTVALKVSDASNRGTDKLTSKAYWDDFKDNDELYAMTFEDMSNVSTRAINLIIDRMDDLKDKVKEDPVSMKTVVKNIEDAENELIGRDPFGGIVKSIREWILAVREAKTARNELNLADQKVSDAEQELDKARQRGNPVDIAVAEQKLTKARDEREKINMKLTKSENKANKAQEKLRKSLQSTADVLGNIQDVFSSVSKLFRAFGDDDTADVIDSICEGFSIMTTLIFGVIAALLLLKTTNPELLALAAILSVIVGLFSFLSGQKNKNIDKQVKASENRVKRLENAYKNLEYAVERAYGTAKYGAEQTALANKELQLSELKRQLFLERSRDSKHREEEKIIDLEGQIVDLENEMRKTVEDITNDLLGISGVGSAAEEMVSAMIESFKNGEDWMVKFDDTFSDMIDNMIMKAIVGRVIGDRIQGIFDLVDQKIKNRGYEEQRTLLSLQGRQKEVEERISNLKTSAAAVGRETTPYVSVYERELADIKRQIAEAEKAYEDAVRVTPSDVDEIRSITNGFRDNVKNEFQAYMDMFGITFGQDADTSKLSSLQAGIQGVTEETASALEAYMNSVSQQVYLHSELLTEIRDAIIGSDSDIGIGVQAQMLLQLQQSHQIQEAIHNILNGALTPSGRAFMVELSA